MQQLSLFDPRPTSPVEPRDPKVPRVSRKRLSKQSTAILVRLMGGPATNLELGGNPGMFGLNYRARISDLRAGGYAVECYDEDHKTGESWYRLGQ